MRAIGETKLDRFYNFFERYDSGRLNGLSEDYFEGMSEAERSTAWNFLVNGFSTSAERISGLYLLDRNRAVQQFKEELKKEVPQAPYRDQQLEIDAARLLMLKYVNDLERDDIYIAMMAEYANSEFPELRAQFADWVPIDSAGERVIDALKGMVFTEVERVPLSAAITKLMEIQGLPFELDNPAYDSVYMLLRSNRQEDKIAGMRQLGMN